MVAVGLWLRVCCGSVGLLFGCDTIGCCDLWVLYLGRFGFAGWLFSCVFVGFGFCWFALLVWC